METFVAMHVTQKAGYLEEITAQRSILRRWILWAWWRSYSKLMIGK